MKSNEILMGPAEELALGNPTILFCAVSKKSRVTGVFIDSVSYSTAIPPKRKNGTKIGKRKNLETIAVSRLFNGPSGET